MRGPFLHSDALARCDTICQIFSLSRWPSQEEYAKILAWRAEFQQPAAPNHWRGLGRGAVIHRRARHFSYKGARNETAEVRRTQSENAPMSRMASAELRRTKVDVLLTNHRAVEKPWQRGYPMRDQPCMARPLTRPILRPSDAASR
jgi:hypothetical protein